MKALTIKALLISLMLSVASPASAAKPVVTKKPPVKAIVVKPLLPTLDTNFAEGDDIAGMVVGANSVNFVGTVETATTSVITTAALGGTDGYIVNLDSNGKQIWNVRLGTPSDDVATAMTTDAAGNLWVVGATTVPLDDVAVPVVSPTTINPSQIVIQPTSQMPPGLRRVMVWQISPTGTLLNTFSSDFPEVVVPTSITAKNSSFIITGTSVTGMSQPASTRGFSLPMSTDGTFGSAQYSPIKPVKTSPVTSVKSSQYSWQSFVSTGGIQGVVGFKPKVPTSVLIKYSLKTGGIVNIYSLPGTLLSMSYKQNIGVVLATTSRLHTYITYIHSN